MIEGSVEGMEASRPALFRASCMHVITRARGYRASEQTKVSRAHPATGLDADDKCDEK